MLTLDRATLVALCRAHHIRRLYLVGSASRDDFTADSDLDFLVLFDRLERPLEQYFGAKYAFEQAFNRPVDLIMPQAVTNPLIYASLEEDKQLLYAA